MVGGGAWAAGGCRGFGSCPRPSGGLRRVSPPSSAASPPGPPRRGPGCPPPRGVAGGAGELLPTPGFSQAGPALPRPPGRPGAGGGSSEGAGGSGVPRAALPRLGVGRWSAFVVSSRVGGRQGGLPGGTWSDCLVQQLLPSFATSRRYRIGIKYFFFAPFFFFMDNTDSSRRFYGSLLRETLVTD